MTVIVGLVAEDGTIYMSGDSAATTPSGDQTVLDNKKVFSPVNSPWFLVGFAGSFRLGQVLQYSLATPLPPGPDDDIAHYMATEFVDAMRECFKEAGYARSDSDGSELGGNCIVGYQGRLYKIEENYQVLMEQRDYIALGSGEAAALGSLFSTQGRPAEERLLTAMKAAVSFSAWCREPFYTMRLPFFEDWHQRKKKKRKRRKKR